MIDGLMTTRYKPPRYRGYLIQCYYNIIDKINELHQAWLIDKSSSLQKNRFIASRQKDRESGKKLGITECPKRKPKPTTPLLKKTTAPNFEL